MIFVVDAAVTNYLFQMKVLSLNALVGLIMTSVLQAGTPASDGKALAAPITDQAWGGTLLGGGIKSNDNFTEGSLFAHAAPAAEHHRQRRHDGRLAPVHRTLRHLGTAGRPGRIARPRLPASFQQSDGAGCQDQRASGAVRRGHLRRGKLLRGLRPHRRRQ